MRVFSLFLAFFGLTIMACQSQPIQASVDAITFNTKLNSTKDAVVLDVRTAEEYAGGFIDKAINLDFYNPAFKSEIAKLDKTKTYFVYCQAGGRSKSAVELMQKEGFTKLVELNGGMTEWESTNLPVKKP
jgi:rhodanese-related sulfurtransferase